MNALVGLACLFLPPEVRERYREQWLADLEGAAELGLSPRRLALGMVGAAVQISATSKGPVMHPIGPVALVLKLVGSPRQRVAGFAIASALVLLGGLALLLR
jgi:hypothetical protein